MASDNKYFWLKLKKDFFKRHDIRIIEAMQNGKDYILFYLKLLCESVDHEGNLRFSDTIPYNEEMLSTITNTNVDVVRCAIKVFSQLGMMEVLNDGTYYMNEVSKMMGYETDWAIKKREYRERQKKDNVLPMSDKSIELELDKDIELDNNNILCSKKGSSEELFGTFWNAYPKKVGKEKCKNWFKTHKPSDALVQKMIEAVEEQKKSKQWSDPQYIPHPYTWLNRGGWDDELTPSKDSTFQSASKTPIMWEDALTGKLIEVK